MCARAGSGNLNPLTRLCAVSSNTAYAQGLGRACVGALLFALPLFMTMEMWWFGFTIDRLRLAVLLLATFPVLVGLSYFAGFERAFGLRAHLLDSFAAIAVAAVVGGAALALFGVLSWGQPFEEIVAKIAVVSFPGALGALLADKQLSQSHRDRGERGQRTFAARLFLMGVGALFVSLNVAPTEEMMLIAFQISPAQAALLAIVSLALLHAFLFWIDFPGREQRRGPSLNWLVLARMSLAAYGLCILTSLGLLWAFGRTDGVGRGELMEFVVVLSFAGVIGAGLAQLVLVDQRNGD